jgi:hypothetical protein
MSEKFVGARPFCMGLDGGLIHVVLWSFAHLRKPNAGCVAFLRRWFVAAHCPVNH